MARYNSIIANYIKNLGSNKIEVDKLSDELKEAVNENLLSYVNAVLDDFSKIDAVSSGSLVDSFRYAIEDGGKTAIIFGNYYYKFVDKGVDGINTKHGSPYSFKTIRVSRSMVDALERWVKREGLKSRLTKERKYNKSKTKIKKESISNERATATAIAISIKREGLRPRPFVKDIINKHKPLLRGQK